MPSGVCRSHIFCTETQVSIPDLAHHGPPALQVGLEQPRGRVQARVQARIQAGVQAWVQARVQAAPQPQQLGQEPLEVGLVQQQARRGLVGEVELPLHQPCQ